MILYINSEVHPPIKTNNELHLIPYFEIVKQHENSLPVHGNKNVNMKQNYLLKVTLILALNLCYSLNSTACSCWPYVEHFCSIVNDGHYIVRATITDSISYEKRTVKLLDNINFEIQEETFTLLGQDGLNCGEYLGQFALGDTLIMALSTWYDEYYLEGACGLHFLRYSNGSVQGNLYPDSTSMPYELFKDNLFDCMDYTNSTSEIETETIRLDYYPNPVENMLNVVSNQGNIEGLELYAISGERMIYKSELSSPSESLDLSPFHKGIYILKARVQGREFIKKVYKK